jgi:site-specific recombinase XerD
VIPLHRDLKKILNLIRSSGKCFNYQNKRRIFKRIRKKINLSEIGWHSFRHTFASHLIMSGVDIVTVSKLLGHSSINTTMIYSHLTEGHVKEAIQKIRF